MYNFGQFSQTHIHTHTNKDIKLRYLCCHPPPRPPPPPLSDFLGNAGALGVCGFFPPVSGVFPGKYIKDMNTYFFQQ